MLYRTYHHPFLFSLNPFISSALSTFPAVSSSTSPSSTQVARAGMEIVEEKALKSSVKPEAAAAAAAVKPINQDSGLSDDLLPGPDNNGAADSDFFVDDLLDFSNASLTNDHPDDHNPEMSANNNGCATTSSSASKSGVGALSPEDEFESLPVSGPTVPVDGLESLEWLSHFSEDTDYSLTCPVAKLPPEASKARSEFKIVMVEVNKPSSNLTPAQTKARTKRARTGGRVWSLGSPALTESPSSSSTASSTSTTTSSCSPPLPWLLFSSYGQVAESLRGRPPAQKSKKKPQAASGDSGLAQQPRRCSHCGVQKTPQWRAGPMGAKTLCNACGVRFKSGRLLPEYRPACSPTFSSELHSNNHRKVMEMRRKKEVETGLLGAPVQSF